MTESPCFFGLTSVRVGTRIIAFLQFWTQFLLAAFLIIKYLVQWHIQTTFQDDQTTKNKSIVNEELDFDISLFSQLFGAILSIYASYYLIKATYKRNIQNINFWLIINTLNLIITISFTVCASWRNGKWELFVLGFSECLLGCYKVYVVYLFYTDEISTDDDVRHNTATSNGRSNSSNNDGRTHRCRDVEIGTDTIENGHY